MRRTALAPLALLALALTACETTQEKSARLKRQAKQVTLAATGLSITHESTEVEVLGAVLVDASEGAAVAVTVRNRSSRALLGVPIAVTVTAAGGRVIYENNAAGLEAALISVPSLAPHETLTWVDDQVPVGAAGASASARLGEAQATSARAPALSVTGVSAIEDPANGSGASATLHNPSAIAQHHVVVFGLARRGGRVVAAGRALLGEVPARGSAPLQLYFLGDSRGAKLELKA